MERRMRVNEDALDAARARAAGLDPVRASIAVRAHYAGDADAGVITIPFLGSDIEIAFPALEQIAPATLPPHIVALLVYHLAISDGSEPIGQWTSFSELPNGGFYIEAFRGYTGMSLARRFGGDKLGLEAVLQRVGAVPMSGSADASWLVPALPRVPICLQWWDADDEFDARAELLFDCTAGHHLTTDGCAVLGAWLTQTLERFADGSCG
jgi:hypothetical protein